MLKIGRSTNICSKESCKTSSKATVCECMSVCIYTSCHQIKSVKYTLILCKRCEVPLELKPKQIKLLFTLILPLTFFQRFSQSAWAEEARPNHYTKKMLLYCFFQYIYIIDTQGRLKQISVHCLDQMGQDNLISFH